MTTSGHPIHVAVLDDYQGVALSVADWSKVSERASITVFQDHLTDQDAVAERLAPFDVVCVMRERTPLAASLLKRLPKLKLIASTGPANASIDLATAAERSITVAHTGYTSAPTIELTWALILASARHIPAEAASVRSGGWQRSLGDDMAGKTLGVLGLGHVGSGVAKVGLAFGMKVVAWSQNLTSSTAEAAGARLVSKEDLLRMADVVSIHLVLSIRTVGLTGAAELALMKPSARLINTSRGPLVVDAALLDALANHRIAGAAIDVYDVEPLPDDHPYRRAENLLATPHIGYVSRGLYERFYSDSVTIISNWLDERGNE
jgi:phosphoglycerate dehydrogenase-like enzyme